MSVQARRTATRSTPSTVVPTTPSRVPTTPLFFPVVAMWLDDDAATRGPLQGTDSFFAVRLTGAGALVAVQLVSRLGAMNTGPPPAPTADIFGAVKGT